VARELTKVFEETRAGTLTELAGYYAAAPPRGEVTVVVAGTGKPARAEPSTDPEARARTLLAQGMTRRDAAHQLAAETGITRNTAYRLVNKLLEPRRSSYSPSGCPSPTEANAECGVRNAESMRALRFRIPHSEFRILPV